MRVTMFALLLSLASVAVAAREADARKPTPDPQVRRQLEELKYEFEVDEDGDYKLVFDVGGSTEKRSQLVYVRSPVESYGVLRVREIWSPGYKSEDKDFPAPVANRLLAATQDNKAGAWAKQGEYAVFVVRLSANAPTKELDDAIDLAITSADQMEAELTPDKDDL
jgi:hypothetical protein